MWPPQSEAFDPGQFKWLLRETPMSSNDYFLLRRLLAGVALFLASRATPSHTSGGRPSRGAAGLEQAETAFLRQRPAARAFRSAAVDSSNGQRGGFSSSASIVRRGDEQGRHDDPLLRDPDLIRRA